MMKRKQFSLKQAIEFHGHLGPYLVLGLLMGKYAIERLKAKPYFGLDVKVWGASSRPKSCLIDGLQLSTGCTYGKGNIKKYKGVIIRARFTNSDNKKTLDLFLRDGLIKKLESTTTHKLSEALARKLNQAKPERLFIENIERAAKSEARNPKSETNSKSEFSNDQNKGGFGH